MATLRAALRLLALALITLLLALCWLLRIPARLFGARTATRLRERQMRAWARAVVAILRVRVEAAGAPPAHPFVLVSNHLSYLDVAVLWRLTPCSFLAKAEVSRWPLLGPLTRLAGTLYVARTRRADVAPALAAVSARLALGEGVVFFPEGTSSAGAEVLPFRSSLFAAAAAAGDRVWPAAISYDTGDPERPAGTQVAWWGDAGFPSHFWNLLKLPRLRARVRFGDRPVSGTDRKLLAREAHAAVTRLFEPTAPCPPAAN